jgi:hypothetical protein
VAAQQGDVLVRAQVGPPQGQNAAGDEDTAEEGEGGVAAVAADDVVVRRHHQRLQEALDPDALRELPDVGVVPVVQAPVLRAGLQGSDPLAHNTELRLLLMVTALHDAPPFVFRRRPA